MRDVTDGSGSFCLLPMEAFVVSDQFLLLDSASYGPWGCLGFDSVGSMTTNMAHVYIITRTKTLNNTFLSTQFYKYSNFY